MARKNRNDGMMRWVVTKDANTKKVIHCREFTTNEAAESYKWEQEEAANPDLVDWEYEIVTLPGGLDSSWM